VKEKSEAFMSVQGPQDQFERESVGDEIEESQDSLDETPLSNSDSQTRDSDSIDVPVSVGEADASSDDLDELDVPALESMPVSSSDELPAPEPTDGPAWYVIHCYSGYENKVRHNLEQRIETMGMKDKIFDVVIPTQEEIEVKDGKRRTVERHIFPGYVLVNMALTEESWYVVRNTPGVTGFVGMGNNPTPLRPEEVAQIVKRMEAEAPTVKVTFKVGERVRIVDGPFNDFRGVVSEIDMERTKVRVMVSFFGRETPVELDFLQVEKA
jgi:transcriptional antiterminator NusG